MNVVTIAVLIVLIIFGSSVASIYLITQKPTKSTLPISEKTSTGQPSVGKCGDNVCDDIEKQTGGCPQDCATRQIQQTTTTQPIEGYRGSEKFGLCDGFSKTGIADDIQDTKALGFGWGRPLGDVFSQETIEKQKGSYDFSIPDEVVKQMQASGIQIFGTVFPTGMPKIKQSVDLSSFRNYVKAVVDRYNGDGKNDMPGLTKITYWEVGIEPFCETTGETCYKNFFDLVKTAYEAAKEVDKSLMISPGGPAPIYDMNSRIDPMGEAIFGYFFKNGGTNYMDFFNFHYLVGKKEPDIAKYISYWKRYVPADKEIWLSETGSRDVGDRFTISSDADVEAEWVKQHIESTFGNGVTKIFWCRAEHSFSDMPKVVKVLQDFSRQYGGNPSGSPKERSTLTQTQSQQQPTLGGASGRCGDGICQDIERTTGGCPGDCS
ncbi:MAG: hypothetical protein QXD72_01750 [Candidatus Aenigmatarchaeota archaeon]